MEHLQRVVGCFHDLTAIDSDSASNLQTENNSVFLADVQNESQTFVFGHMPALVPRMDVNHFLGLSIPSHRSQLCCRQRLGPGYHAQTAGPYATALHVSRVCHPSAGCFCQKKKKEEARMTHHVAGATFESSPAVRALSDTCGGRF